MKAICISFALLLSFASTAQKSRNDWEKESLQGKVKTIAYFYRYLDDPTGTGALFIDSSQYTVDSFNTAGYKSSQSRHQYGGESVREEFEFNDTVLYSSINGKVWERTEFKRNNKGNVVVKRQLDQDGNTVTKTDYDTLENPVLETRYDSDTPWTWRMYTYESGRLTMEKDSTSYGVGHSRYYRYNDKGQLTSINDETIGQCTFRIELTYTYDERGNKTSDTETIHGRPSTRTWKYDEHNNPVLEESSRDGAVHRTVASEYDYDTQGNWTRRLDIFTTNFQDIKTRSVTIRNIEYY